MPPSGRKGKTRVRRAPATERADVHEPSDAETPDAIQTPSRSSRKRARPIETTTSAGRNTRRKVKDARVTEREDTEGTEAQHSDAELEPTLPTEQEIISHLRVAERQVNATEDYANDLLEGQENVPGYGKIAGRDWSFIIRKIEVNIGRPETQEKMTPVTGENGHVSTPTAKTVVDIDLGPDRQISRSHAIIAYDDGRWFIIVNGRNGLRVDGHLLKRGAKQHLRNGSVIEIASTQMAFITTAADDSEGPVWDAAIIKQTQKSSEEDDDGDEFTRTNGYRASAHPSSHQQLAPTNGHTADPNGQHQGQQQQQHRSHPHSQRTTFQETPGTPLRSLPSMVQSSPAANYARGVMMESTESIDYSADNAKDLKPPHSYAQLIGMAILSTQEQQMTLNNIYKWIMANYAFYRFNTGGWQNSIRHNLSLNKAFTKIARRTDEPGKGMKWMIEPTEFETFVQQGMKGCRRPQPIAGTQSTFGSPSSPMQSIVMRVGANGVKKDDDLSPPLNAYRPMYPTATEAFTPDRGPKRKMSSQGDSKTGLGISGEQGDFEYLQRLTPRNAMNAAAAAGSPPALYVNEEGRVGPLDTPFPLQPSQRLAPPSTLKRPSDFIQFSSPAPFWKMEGLVGSTPFKPYDLSPIKTPFSLKKEEADFKKDDDVKLDAVDKVEDGGEMKSKSSPVVTSSSPPGGSSMSHALDASPTLSRPATAVAKTLSQMATAGNDDDATDVDTETAAELPQPSETRTQSLTPVLSQYQQQPPSAPNGRYAPLSNVKDPSAPQMQSYNARSTAPPHAPSHEPPQPFSHGFADDGEDEGIDLAK
nr:fork-head transcriptional regulator 2 [Quercus suber]